MKNYRCIESEPGALQDTLPVSEKGINYSIAQAFSTTLQLSAKRRTLVGQDQHGAY